MDESAMMAARMAVQTPAFLALGVGILVALGHLVTGRSTVPALLLLIGFLGMTATQTFWILFELLFALEVIDYTFYESWASTALNIGMVAVDALFLTVSLASVFVGRLGVRP